MAANYVLLEKITVGAAGASSVTFSGIPQTGYTDLVMKYSTRSKYTGGTANTIQIGFYSSTANFTGITIEGDGASATSSTSARNLGATPSATATANTFSNGEVYIPNYTSANYKSFSVDNVQEDNVAAAYSNLNVGLWSITSAITSIEVYTNVTTWAQYSTFYLYGVAALGTTPAISPYATGGDTIMTDGSYWYHAFVASGTFTPLKGLTCDALVIAGGGSGAVQNSGAGGAGGYRSTTSLSLSTATTVTVGAGGAATSTIGTGAVGTDTTFSSITSSGGGAGKGYLTNGGAGGSGGGAGGYAGGPAATGGASSPVTSPVQGYAGGNGSTDYEGGGGGGAGAVGGVGTAGTGGNGGAGSNAHSSWASATGTGVSGYYAGGGGAGGSTTSGTGGSGGGGAGAGSGTATSGTANTGSGGGSQRTTGTSGAGGSGLVIVRYAV